MWTRGLLVGLLLVLCGAAPVDVYLFNEAPQAAYVVFGTDSLGVETTLGLYWTWGEEVQVTQTPRRRAAPGILNFTVPNHIRSVRVVPHADVANDTSVTGAGTPRVPPALRIWPNPSSGDVTIHATDAGVYRLYNARGQRVATVPMTAGDNVVRLDVPSGVYYFRRGAMTGRLVRVR